MLKIDSDLMSNICNYMVDEIREELVSALTPCTNEEFLLAYVEKCPEFKRLLYHEFKIMINEPLFSPIDNNGIKVIIDICE